MIWNHYSIQSHTFLFFLSMFIVYWWFPHWAPHSKIRHYSYRNSEHHFNWSNISQAFKIFTLYNSHFLQWIFKKKKIYQQRKKQNKKKLFQNVCLTCIFWFLNLGWIPPHPTITILPWRSSLFLELFLFICFIFYFHKIDNLQHLVT